jgi:hypothetical protein
MYRNLKKKILNLMGLTMAIENLQKYLILAFLKF